MALTGEPPGATPLDADDLAGLKPTWVATPADLNLAEQRNIEQATRWAFAARRPVATVPDLLTIAFVDRVHRRLFGDVWAWAGQRRRRETNIGVEPVMVTVAMQDVLSDVTWWHEHQTFAPAETAVRLHHRLVSVHPYVKGNGRHSRFLADLYLHLNGHPRLGWNRAALVADNDTRTVYIAALRKADDGDYGLLIDFATS